MSDIIVPNGDISLGPWVGVSGLPPGIVTSKQPWRRQPQNNATPPNWGNELVKNALAIFDGRSLWTPNQSSPLTPFVNTSKITPCPGGIGAGFDGSAGSVLGFSGIGTIPAASAVTIEAIVVGSSFPSLASIINSWTTQISTGAINANPDAGKIRGILSFNGASNPYHISWWDGALTRDSGISFALNQLNHIIITKAPGTGAVLINIYLNGVVISSGTNTAPADTSGPYLYIGGRHYSSSASITGVVPFAGLYTRVMSAAEVAERYKNPWQIFESIEDIIYSDNPAPNLYSTMDESTPSDTDYIQASSNGTCEVALSDPGGSPGSSQIVSYRLAGDEGGATVTLAQIGTPDITIFTDTIATVPGTPTTYDHELSTIEKALITDYTALKLQFEKTS